VTTPVHQQQQYHCNKGNNTSLTTGRRLRIDDNNNPIV
jgi:hypothetical protein